MDNESKCRKVCLSVTDMQRRKQEYVSKSLTEIDTPRKKWNTEAEVYDSKHDLTEKGLSII